MKKRSQFIRFIELIKFIIELENKKLVDFL